MPNDNHLLDVLTREGVLINVSVRFWRAAKKIKDQRGPGPTRRPDNVDQRGHAY